MFIVRFRSQGALAWGRLHDGLIEEISDPFTAGGALATHAPTDVELVCPATPSKIVCVGRNYRAHAEEMGHDVPDEPMLFLKPPSALIGSGESIRLPRGVSPVDFEGELVLVIGKRCRELDAHTAPAAVLGVTCGNDVTARTLQRKDGQWARAKGFDTFAPVGPMIATEVGLGPFELVTRVNGVERQRANTEQMIFSPVVLLEFISRVMTLEPGDLIFTGTPVGVGPLAAGDIVEVEISGVGMLTNPVSALEHANDLGDFSVGK